MKQTSCMHQRRMIFGNVQLNLTSDGADHSDNETSLMFQCVPVYQVLTECTHQTLIKLCVQLQAVSELGNLCEWCFSVGTIKSKS